MPEKPADGRVHLRPPPPGVIVPPGYECQRDPFSGILFSYHDSLDDTAFFVVNTATEEYRELLRKAFPQLSDRIPRKYGTVRTD